MSLFEHCMREVEAEMAKMGGIRVVSKELEKKTVKKGSNEK